MPGVDRAKTRIVRREQVTGGSAPIAPAVARCLRRPRPAAPTERVTQQRCRRRVLCASGPILSLKLFCPGRLCRAFPRSAPPPPPATHEPKDRQKRPPLPVLLISRQPRSPGLADCRGGRAAVPGACARGLRLLSLRRWLSSGTPPAAPPAHAAVPSRPIALTNLSRVGPPVARLVGWSCGPISRPHPRTGPCPDSPEAISGSSGPH